MKRKFELTRLPDLSDGRINYKWRPVDDIKLRMFISWDYNWIKDEAAKLKVDESKIYEIDL